MLITFRSEATGPIMMFGDVGTALLKMMGQSGVVPGAITGPDVARAAAALKAAVAREKAAAPAKPGDDDESDRIGRKVGLATRAVPLIDMLERAAAAKADVLWDKG